MDIWLIFQYWWGFELGSEKDSGEGQWLSLAAAGRRSSRLRFAGAEAMRPCFPEKAICINPPAVPKPTQVGGYKDTKARERNLVKELGNIAP